MPERFKKVCIQVFYSFFFPGSLSVGDSEWCLICKEICKVIQSDMLDKHSRELVKKAIHEICNELPDDKAIKVS